MTLLVYKDGVLATDRGCTRFDTREEFEKIRYFREHDMVVAYAGSTDAIGRHMHLINKPGATTPLELPAMDCEGFILTDMGAANGWMLSEFSCFEASTGRGVPVVLNTDHPQFMGNATAVSMAMAMAHAQPEWSAERIVREVAQICNAVDVKFGVSTFNTHNRKLKVES